MDKLLRSNVIEADYRSVKFCPFDTEDIKSGLTSSVLAAVVTFSVVFILSMSYVYSRNGAPARFVKLEYASNENDTGEVDDGRYFLSFEGSVTAAVSDNPSVPVFFIDILGSKVDVNPFVMQFTHGPAESVRLNQVSVYPHVVRATFFMRHHVVPELRQIRNGFEVSFSKRSASAKPVEKKRTPFSLIEPEKQSAAPVVPDLSVPPAGSFSSSKQSVNISVRDADVAELLKELARRAERTIHLKGAIEGKISLDLSEVEAEEAIRTVASRIGAIIHEKGDEIWVTATEPEKQSAAPVVPDEPEKQSAAPVVPDPMNLLSDTDMVNRVDMSGMALGDVLRAMGRIAELNVILDKSMDTVRDRSVQAFFQRVSFREAFKTLLRHNDLVAKPVDGRTLVIMTLAGAREAAGREIRVVETRFPVARVMELVKISAPNHLSERFSLFEDLGKLILAGDPEAVKRVLEILGDIESKLVESGTGRHRAYFQPLNTNPEELIKTVSDSFSNEEDLRLIMDRRTDLIMLHGPFDTVSKALALMKKLDLNQTRQVLIHIRLIEIHRSDLEELGLNLPSELGGVDNLFNPGESSIVLPAGFTGFSENSRIRTLANPTIRCMDGEEASINISEQIPVKNITTEYLPIATASLAARTSENWTTSEVGIKLNISPKIHVNNDVTMDLNVDFTELISLVEGQPWTAKRNIQTRIRVKDRETVVIGGLIRRKRDNRRRPVPILQKIPLIRNLVRSLGYRNTREEESEMVILITPRVVEKTTELP